MADTQDVAGAAFELDIGLVAVGPVAEARLQILLRAHELIEIGEENVEFEALLLL